MELQHFEFYELLIVSGTKKKKFISCQKILKIHKFTKVNIQGIAIDNSCLPGSLWDADG